MADENKKSATTKSAVTFRLDSGLLDRLDAYADVSSLSKTKIVEFALNEFLNNKGKELYADLLPDWQPKTQEEIIFEKVKRLQYLYDKQLIPEDDYKVALDHLTAEL